MYGLRELVGKYTGSDNGRIEILLYWLRLGAELLHWRQVLKPLDERGRKASGYVLMRRPLTVVGLWEILV
jgi:hypothetical protein